VQIFSERLQKTERQAQQDAQMERLDPFWPTENQLKIAMHASDFDTKLLELKTLSVFKTKK
jgi:hypothetical protein